MKKKSLPANRRGFTLIELMVAIGVFGIIIVAASTILIDVLRNSVRATLQNDLRQNGQKVLSDIGASIRAGGCITSSGDSDIKHLMIYDKDCSTNLVDYSFSATDFTIKKTIGGATTDLISSKVAPCQSTAGTCSVGCTNGFSATFPPGSQKSVNVTLNLSQKPGETKPEYCTGVTLSDSFSTRN